VLNLYLYVQLSGTTVKIEQVPDKYSILRDGTEIRYSGAVLVL